MSKEEKQEIIDEHFLSKQERRYRDDIERLIIKYVKSVVD
jgi:hypothetical protein